MLIQFGGERRRGCIAKSRVRLLAVVILDPGRDLDAGIRKAEEQGLVQKFIAHPAVEAFAKAVLRRFAWRDVMLLHAHLPAPRQHCIAGQLSVIVADDHAGLAPLGDQLG